MEVWCNNAGINHNAGWRKCMDIDIVSAKHFFFMINLSQILLTFFVGCHWRLLTLNRWLWWWAPTMPWTGWARRRVRKTNASQGLIVFSKILWKMQNFCVELFLFLQVEGEVWLLTQPLWLVWSSTRSTRNPTIAKLNQSMWEKYALWRGYALSHDNFCNCLLCFLFHWWICCDLEWQIKLELAQPQIR